MKFHASVKRAMACASSIATILVLTACGGDADTNSPSANRAPKAAFSAQVSADGTYLIVDGAMSSDPDGDYIFYNWDFDNNTTSNNGSAEVFYSAAGTYNLSLTVFDGEYTSDAYEISVEVDDLLRPTISSNGFLETEQVASGREYYELHCINCHGTDARSEVVPIDLDKVAYDHSSTSRTGAQYSLEAYISNFMPTESLGGPSACVGECATNVTAYLNWLNGVLPTPTPTITPTPTPTAQPTIEMRMVQISNPSDINIPSGTATPLAVLQEGVSVNVNGVSTVGLEVIPSNYPSVYGVAFALSGAAVVGAQIDITAGYYVNEGVGYFDRTMGELPVGDYALTVTIYEEEGVPGDTVLVNFAVVDDSAGNVAPVAVDSSTNTTGDVPLTVSFDGSGSYDDEFILTYTWSFDDGSAPVSGTDSQVQHTYTTPGTYTATLRVVDNEGADDTINISIVVISTFDAASVYSDHCAVCHGASGEGVFPFPAIQGNTYTRADLESDIDRMYSVNTEYVCPQGLDCVGEMADYIFQVFATEQQ